MKTKISLSQAIDGYKLDARARQLRPRTIIDYQNGYRHLHEFIGDPPIADISIDDIRQFLAHLGGQSITPDGVAPRPTRKLANKSIANIHVALSALWTWAVAEGFAIEHVVRAVRPPKPDQPMIEPFRKEDVKAMLHACEKAKTYINRSKKEQSSSRPTAARDRAIILTLLDTGGRVSEICYNPTLETPGLLVEDWDQRNLYLRVLGKGGKERILPISHRTSKAIWKYMATRPDALPTDPLFLSVHNEPLSNDGLRQLIKNLGKRSGVTNAHPHRFRHTFAVNLLRNGANALELQRMLGHSTLDMVKRYVDIAQVDVDRAHKRASPVMNWRL
jgi:site-specific recombinase XerD